MNWLWREFTGFIDLLLPSVCPACLGPLSHQSATFCLPCNATIYPLPAGRCSCCALPFVALNSSRHLCADCSRKLPPYAEVFAAGLYAGALKKCLQRFKYAHAVDLDRPLANLLLQVLPLLAVDETIVPVPLHPSRLRKRGFNQALLLAKVLAYKLHLSLDSSLLQRIVDGHSQQGLSAKERSFNLNGAFVAKKNLNGRRFVLVDDVMTTGFTVTACTTTLLNAGAKSVRIAVIARAPRH